MSERWRWRGRLEDGDRPPAIEPQDEPPPDAAGRGTQWTAEHDTATRDTTPALGKRGGPAGWQPAEPDAGVALARPGFGDARWSFLYRAADTRYAAARPAPGQVAQANRRMRSAPVEGVHGPFIKPPVWTWEVPLYFWVGGLASGASFVALACDLTGDHRSARVARRVSLGAVTLAPPLLIADLGRPGRFLNMLRIFKPRSPMSMGAWCLMAFSATAAGAVGADLLQLRRAGRALGAVTAVLGGYLGSYTGVLLAATAVPLWARSRSVLGPIFICTATASGAAATRLTLAAQGMPQAHPTRQALGMIETASILSELVLSHANHRRLGRIGEVTRRGRPGTLFRLAEGAVIAGLSTRVWARRAPAAAHAASGLYLLGALAFRYAWVEGGKASANDHQSVVAVARGRKDLRESDTEVPRGPNDLREGDTEVPRGPRLVSEARRPLPLGPARRAWGEAVRRTSLAVEGFLRRG